ncbi:hypothetical protein DPEC_G00379040 [Dallia pectoralis]|nr:hypothetical protein DPEC_G00379040 [Dallia pectoralis]
MANREGEMDDDMYTDEPQDPMWDSCRDRMEEADHQTDNQVSAGVVCNLDTDEGNAPLNHGHNSISSCNSRNKVQTTYPCDRSRAALEKSASLITEHPVTVSHSVHALISSKNSLITPRRMSGYEVLLTAPNAVIQMSSFVNPAELLTTRDDGDAHDCIATRAVESQARVDLHSEALPDSHFSCLLMYLHLLTKILGYVTLVLQWSNRPRHVDLLLYAEKRSGS